MALPRTPSNQAEASLADSGFQFLVQTGSSVLAVLPLPGAAEAERSVRRQALDLAKALARRFPAGTAVPVSLHVAGALLSGGRVVGGEIGDFPGWPAGIARDGIQASPAALEGLD